MNLDEELLRKFCDGDNSAFVSLYTRYRKPVYGFALRMLSSDEKAMDAVEAVFSRMLDRRDTLANVESFRAWIFTSVRNECLNDLRRSKILNPLDESIGDGPGADPYESSVRNDETMIVGKALQGLSAEERESLVLREYHGMSYAEIAAVCDTTESAVKSRIFKARKRLATLLKPYSQEG